MARRSALYVMTTWSRGMGPHRVRAAAGGADCWRPLAGEAVSGLAAGLRVASAPCSTSCWSPVLSGDLSMLSAAAGLVFPRGRCSRMRAVRGWQALQRRLRPSDSCEPSSSRVLTAVLTAALSADPSEGRRPLTAAVRGRELTRDEGGAGGNAAAGSRYIPTRLRKLEHKRRGWS